MHTQTELFDRSPTQHTAPKLGPGPCVSPIGYGWKRQLKSRTNWWNNHAYFINPIVLYNIIYFIKTRTTDTKVRNIFQVTINNRYNKYTTRKYNLFNLEKARTSSKIMPCFRINFVLY